MVTCLSRLPQKGDSRRHFILKLLNLITHSLCRTRQKPMVLHLLSKWGLDVLGRILKRLLVYKDISFWPASPETRQGSASAKCSFFHFHRFSGIRWSLYISIFLYLFISMPLSLYIYIITSFLKTIHTHTHIYIIPIISKCYCMLSFPKGFL